jgi:mono/diheme cytochrome c family protein
MTPRKHLFPYLPQLILLWAATAPVRAETGKALFENLCVSCHSFGNTDDKEIIDLKPAVSQRSPDWMLKIITNPEKLTSQKDPIQLELIKKYGTEMPNLEISQTDARKILEFMKSESAMVAPAVKEKPAEIVVTPELLFQGKAWFTGRQPLAKGGAACLACHSLRVQGISGGNLARDLTTLYSRMGETRVRRMLESLKFPVMKNMYIDHPLSAEEIEALTALLKDAGAYPGKSAFPVFPCTGLGVFALIFGLLFFINKRRTG